MRRILLFFFFLSLLTYVVLSPAMAADELYATCDLCGLCQTQGALQPTPQSWESCRQCLYPNDTGDPMYTLVVDPDTNSAPTPAPGRLYTMIGCIQTTMSFTNDGAAVSVVNLLLGYLFRIAGGIAFLYIIYGAYLVLTSQNDPERLDQGKRTIWGAIVGLVFCLFSVFIINLLASGVLQLPGFSSGPTPTP